MCLSTACTQEPSEIRKGIGSPGTELQMVGAAMCAPGTELTVRLLSNFSILRILVVIHYYFCKGKVVHSNEDQFINS